MATGSRRQTATESLDRHFDQEKRVSKIKWIKKFCPAMEVRHAIFYRLSPIPAA
jgi:hypothetical protein